jgi:hypothetical protein
MFSRSLVRGEWTRSVQERAPGKPLWAALDALHHVPKDLRAATSPYLTAGRSVEPTFSWVQDLLAAAFSIQNAEPQRPRMMTFRCLMFCDSKFLRPRVAVFTFRFRAASLRAFMSTFGKRARMYFSKASIAGRNWAMLLLMSSLSAISLFNMGCAGAPRSLRRFRARKGKGASFVVHGSQIGGRLRCASSSVR